MRPGPRMSYRLIPTRAVILAVSASLLASCGGADKLADDTGHKRVVSLNAGTAVVASVGAIPITQATYQHWMSIGAATVEMPKPQGPLPKSVIYEPPDFTACVTHLQATEAKATKAELEAKCRKTYEGIRDRILDFLITAYWLRAEASKQHLSVAASAVHAKFEQERQANYPTASSFRRLREASRQTVPDLEFATETQMLSARLLEEFSKAHPQKKPEQATIVAFNRHIRGTWIPQTSCVPGYVVPDCKQYKG